MIPRLQFDGSASFALCMSASSESVQDIAQTAAVSDVWSTLLLGSVTLACMTAESWEDEGFLDDPRAPFARACLTSAREDALRSVPTRIEFDNFDSDSRIIFLDVDGVLHPLTAYLFFAKTFVLKALCSASGARIVLSSDWRLVSNPKAKCECAARCSCRYKLLKQCMDHLKAHAIPNLVGVTVDQLAQPTPF